MRTSTSPAGPSRLLKYRGDPRVEAKGAYGKEEARCASSRRPSSESAPTRVTPLSRQAAWTRALALVLLFLLLPAASHGHSTDPQLLAREVYSIFKAKCLDCHAADLPRPDGHFGYVLDLGRVADNPDMVVRGEPEKSELYLMVFHEEMPGEDADVPPLTPQEKETVKLWIEAGAPALAEASATPTPAPQPVRRELPFKKRLIRALGQFHPPSSHFPIALLICALPAELMWKLTRKRSWKATVRFCVTLGAASAVLTATLGWCDAAFSNYTGASAGILEWHRWLGTATAVWAVITAIVSELAHQSGQPRSLRYTFRGLLLTGIILLSLAGYFGASLTFGPNHFRW